MDLGLPQKEHLKKQNDISWVILFFSIIISGTMFMFQDETVALIGIIVLASTCFILSKLDIMHPYTWFIPLFTMYIISDPILILLGLKMDFGYLYNLLLYNWIALVVIAVILGPTLLNYNKDNFSISLLDNHFKIILKPIYIISVLLTSVLFAYVIKSGISTKKDLALDSSFVTGFASFFSLFILSFGLLLSLHFLSKSKSKILLIFTFFWGALAFLIIGERNIILSLAWITLFLVNVLYKKINKTLIIITALSVIALLPFMQSLKSFAVSGEITTEIDYSQFQTEIFNAEFQSASRNFHQLLSMQDYWTYYWGETLIWDVMRSFLPFFDYISPTEWFTQTFNGDLYEIGGGRGFSVLAEGYMNFGLLGVIIWAILLALFIKTLYKLSINNIIWLNIYILAMPIIIYVTRADFANLMSQLGKQIIIPIFTIFIAMHIIKRLTFKKISL